MSVTALHLTTSGSFGSSSFNTASISPTAGKIVLIAVGSDNGGGPTPNIPTISGCNITWTLIATRLDTGTNFRRISLFRGFASNPSIGELTLDFAGQTQGDGCNWSVAEFGNVDNSGTNGSVAIVQSAVSSGNGVTSLTVTLGAFSDTDNATFGAIFKNGTETISAGSGFTQLGQNNVRGSIQSQWRVDNDTTCNWTWGTSHVVCGVAVELKEKIYPVLGGMI